MIPEDRLERIRAATEEVPDLEKAELLMRTLESGETGYREAFSRMFEFNIRPHTLRGRFEKASVASIRESIHDLCRKCADVVAYRQELNAQMAQLEELDKRGNRTRSPLGLSMTVGFMSNDIGNTIIARIRAIFDNFTDRFSRDVTTREIMERIKTDLPSEEQSKDAIILELRGRMPAEAIKTLSDYFESRVANVYVGQLKLLDALQIACAKVADSNQPKETMLACYHNKSGGKKDVMIHCDPNGGRIALTDLVNTPPDQVVKPLLMNCVKIEIPPQYKVLA